jgi:peptide-methionine (R)-S-oxide reductase
MSEKYTDLWDEGIYYCSKCSEKLFSSSSKFKSGTQWPSFREGENIATKEDHSFGMERVEILCKKCNQHLGHVFDDGKISGDTDQKAGKRYCVLSDSLEFKE